MRTNEGLLVGQGERLYDLLLTGKRRVTWGGVNGINAAHRYADAHPDTGVIAWREHQQTNLIVQWSEGMRIID